MLASLFSDFQSKKAHSIEQLKACITQPEDVAIFINPNHGRSPEQTTPINAAEGEIYCKLLRNQIHAPADLYYFLNLTDNPLVAFNLLNTLKHDNSIGFTFKSNHLEQLIDEKNQKLYDSIRKHPLTALLFASINYRLLGNLRFDTTDSLFKFISSLIQEIQKPLALKVINTILACNPKTANTTLVKYLKSPFHGLNDLILTHTKTVEQLKNLVAADYDIDIFTENAKGPRLDILINNKDNLVTLIKNIPENDSTDHKIATLVALFKTKPYFTHPDVTKAFLKKSANSLIFLENSFTKIDKYEDLFDMLHVTPDNQIESLLKTSKISEKNQAVYHKNLLDLLNADLTKTLIDKAPEKIKVLLKIKDINPTFLSTLVKATNTPHKLATVLQHVEPEQTLLLLTAKRDEKIIIPEKTLELINIQFVITVIRQAPDKLYILLAYNDIKTKMNAAIQQMLDKHDIKRSTDLGNAIDAAKSQLPEALYELPTLENLKLNKPKIFPQYPTHVPIDILKRDTILLLPSTDSHSDLNNSISSVTENEEGKQTTGFVEISKSSSIPSFPRPQKTKNPPIRSRSLPPNNRVNRTVDAPPKTSPHRSTTESSTTSSPAENAPLPVLFPRRLESCLDKNNNSTIADALPETTTDTISKATSPDTGFRPFPCQNDTDTLPHRSTTEFSTANISGVTSLTEETNKATVCVDTPNLSNSAGTALRGFEPQHPPDDKTNTLPHGLTTEPSTTNASNTNNTDNNDTPVPAKINRLFITKEHFKELTPELYDQLSEASQAALYQLQDLCVRDQLAVALAETRKENANNVALLQHVFCSNVWRMLNSSERENLIALLLGSPQLIKDHFSIYQALAQWPDILVLLSYFNNKEAKSFIQLLQKPISNQPLLVTCLQHGDNLIKVIKQYPEAANSLIANPKTRKLITHFSHLLKLAKYHPKALHQYLLENNSSLITNTEQLVSLVASITEPSEHTVETSHDDNHKQLIIRTLLRNERLVKLLKTDQSLREQFIVASDNHEQAIKKLRSFGEEYPIIRDALIITSIALLMALTVTTLSLFFPPVATFLGVTALVPLLPTSFTAITTSTCAQVAIFTGIVGGITAGVFILFSALVRTLVHLNRSPIDLSSIQATVNKTTLTSKHGMKQHIDVTIDSHNETSLTPGFIPTYIQVNQNFEAFDVQDDNLQVEITKQILAARVYLCDAMHKTYTEHDHNTTTFVKVKTTKGHLDKKISVTMYPCVLLNEKNNRLNDSTPAQAKLKVSLNFNGKTSEVLPTHLDNKPHTYWQPLAEGFKSLCISE